MPFRALSRWLKPRTSGNARSTARLSAEALEGREMPAVTLASIADNTFANNKPLFVPVQNTATVNGTTTFTASSANAGVNVSVLPAGQTLKLDVSGVDNTGTAFTGTITIRLFADAAPLAVQRIVDLANAGFYDGKTFFRTQDNFVIQGGSSNNTAADPGTQPNLVDEYNAEFTFNSHGMVAFANAVDDANGTQFFITDIDQPLATRPQFLNFNHTIFGQLTSGFDVFEKIIQGTVKSGTTDQAQNPAVITDATIITDKANSVLKVTATGGFTGNSDITVSAVDGDGVSKEIKFRVTAALDPSDDRPFLNPIPAITVESGSSKIVTLPLVNLDGDNANLTYRVGVPGNLFGTPANVSASVNAATGELTVTANSGFTGSVQLLVGVRDNTDRVGSLGSAQNFDTEVVTVNVVAQGPTSVLLGASRTTAQTNRTVLLTATVSGMNSASGQVRFLDGATVLGTVRVLDGRALLTTSFATASTHAITAEFTPTGSSTPTTSNTVSIIVATGTAPVQLTAQAIPAGNLPVVIAKNADGSQRFTAQPFEVSFTGGVRVAVADVTGDGQRDVIAVPGFGGGPFIKIYDGVDGALLRTVPIFEETFRGGLYVDVKDALGTGYAQILVGAGFTGGPRVSLYDFVQNKVVLNYFAYDSSLRSGVVVSLADLRGGEQFQILTTPGTNGGPVVSVFNPRRTDGFPIPNTIGSFFAGPETDRAGRRIGAGDIGTDGNRKIQVFAFADSSTTALAEFDPIQQGLFPAT
ncbi:MAG: peptidylprolyl isomerase [Planctomycetia bacterium]|nr:peptidylprolyl isomerase [Planctomycetia bacterium]